jgi:dephospho-CoA kinase
MKRVALTGGIATGKSHVRAEFERLGVPTIDADTLARDAAAPGSPGLEAIVARFGPGILTAAGALDRRRLGAIAFSDPHARHDLEQIIHPIVRARTDEWFAALDRGQPFAIADIPLLYETGRERDFDEVVVTTCSEDTQVRRVMQRDSVSEQEARQRLAAQLPTSEKVSRADYVINTDGSYDETNRQVRKVYDALVGGSPPS